MKFCNYLPVLLACVVAFCSCHRNTAAKDLITYVNDPGNGITQEQDIRDNHLQLQYIPSTLQVLSVNGTELSATALQQEKQKYDSFMYFRFSILNSVYKPAGDTLNYLNFNMQDDLMLVTDNKDTVPCVFYQKIAGANKFNNEFIVVFEKPLQEMSDFHFVYTDKVFGLATRSFPFRRADLDHIPQL